MMGDAGSFVRSFETAEKPSSRLGISFGDTHSLHTERVGLHSVGETRGEGDGLSVFLS